MKHKKYYVFVTLKTKIMPLRVTITGEQQAQKVLRLVQRTALFAWMEEK